MTFPHGGASQIWRDYAENGVPSSGAHEPHKYEIRPYLAQLEARVGPIPRITRPDGTAHDDIQSYIDEFAEGIGGVILLPDGDFEGAGFTLKSNVFVTGTAPKRHLLPLEWGRKGTRPDPIVSGARIRLTSATAHVVGFEDAITFAGLSNLHLDANQLCLGAAVEPNGAQICEFIDLDIRNARIAYHWLSTTTHAFARNLIDGCVAWDMKIATAGAEASDNGVIYMHRHDSLNLGVVPYGNTFRNMFLFGNGGEYTATNAATADGFANQNGYGNRYERIHVEDSGELGALFNGSKNVARDIYIAGSDKFGVQVGTARHILQCTAAPDVVLSKRRAVNNVTKGVTTVVNVTLGASTDPVPRVGSFEIVRNVGIGGLDGKVFDVLAVTNTSGDIYDIELDVDSSGFPETYVSGGASEEVVQGDSVTLDGVVYRAQGRVVAIDGTRIALNSVSGGPIRDGDNLHTLGGATPIATVERGSEDNDYEFLIEDCAESTLGLSEVGGTTPSGTFAVGETVTSGAKTAVVRLYTFFDGIWMIALRSVEGGIQNTDNWQVGDVLTGGTSGATLTLTEVSNSNIGAVFLFNSADRIRWKGIDTRATPKHRRSLTTGGDTVIDAVCDGGRVFDANPSIQGRSNVRRFEDVGNGLWNYGGQGVASAATVGNPVISIRATEDSDASRVEVAGSKNPLIGNVLQSTPDNSANAGVIQGIINAVDVFTVVPKPVSGVVRFSGPDPVPDPDTTAAPAWAAMVPAQSVTRAGEAYDSDGVVAVKRTGGMFSQGLEVLTEAEMATRIPAYDGEVVKVSDSTVGASNFWELWIAQDAAGTTMTARWRRISTAGV